MGTPEIGTGCTLHIGSDSYPYTVIATAANSKDIEIQADKFTPAEGHEYYGTQKYTYEPNSKGDVKQFRHHNGHWRQLMKNAKGGLVIVKRDVYYLNVGERVAYSDPGF